MANRHMKRCSEISSLYTLNVNKTYIETLIRILKKKWYIIIWIKNIKFRGS